MFTEEAARLEVDEPAVSPHPDTNKHKLMTKANVRRIVTTHLARESLPPLTPLGTPK